MSPKRRLWVLLAAAALLAGSWCLFRPRTVKAPALPISREEPLSPGLVAVYRDRDHQVRLVVPAPRFYLEAGESVHPSLSAQFQAQWQGFISILETADYTFGADHARIEVNGKELSGEPVRLTPGNYPISITWARRPGPARMQFTWAAEQFVEEPVPGAVLRHRPSDLDRRDVVMEEGRFLVQELGCVNCHSAPSSGLKKRMGPNLSGVGSRVASAWLAKWLEDPSGFRGAARMPAFGDVRERGDMVAYLASLKEEPRIRLRRAVPEDVERGKQLYGALGCMACHEQPGLSLQGLGSKWKPAELAAYLLDPSRIDAEGRMPSMMLSEREALALAAYLTESRHPAFEQPAAEGDSNRGQALIQSAGCLNCHRLQAVENRQQAPSLRELSPTRGCLEESPHRHLPRYRLSDREREAIRAFLAGYREHPDKSSAPVYEFYQSVRRFGCTACHELDHFEPAVRLPEAAPPLSMAGARLRTPWIEEVLQGKQRIRRWLELRMPQYDLSVVRPLVSAFAKAAGVGPEEEGPTFVATTQQQGRGVQLLGSDPRGGLACIRCHDWGRFEALGERAPQLMNVTQRLRYAWFYRFMLSPGRIYSGTSMPDHFSDGTREAADRAISSLWAALSLGKDMPLPAGLLPDAVALGKDARPVPVDTPVVVRCFMPEAGPAAVAVGLPGGISYCFDAGECRLRYVWEGGFIDLSEQLQRKAAADGYTPLAQLVGTIFYRSEEFPFHSEGDDAGGRRRFLGYRLLDGYPEFQYEVEGVKIFERIVPSREKRGITRKFRVQSVTGPLWFVAASTQGTAVTSSLGELQDGRLRLPEGENIQFDVHIVLLEDQSP